MTVISTWAWLVLLSSHPSPPSLGKTYRTHRKELSRSHPASMGLDACLISPTVTLTSAHSLYSPTYSLSFYPQLCCLDPSFTSLLLSHCTWSLLCLWNPSHTRTLEEIQDTFLLEKRPWKAFGHLWMEAGADMFFVAAGRRESHMDQISVQYQAFMFQLVCVSLLHARR